MATAPLAELAIGPERFSQHVPGALDLSGAGQDPKDDKFLACAVEGGAHYLVSSDRDSLDMRHYQQVVIVNSGQFLLALQLSAMDASALVDHFRHDVLTDIQAAVPLDRDTAERVEKALARLDHEEETENR